MGKIKPIKGAKHDKIKQCDNCVYFLTSKVDYNKSSPIFSLKYMKDNKYHLKNCTGEERESLIKKMSSLSVLTWIDISNSSRHGLGTEKINIDSIKGDSLPKSVDKDTTLLSIRFHGKKPMVGFREKDIFHIIWLDRDFSLYKHG